MTTLHLRRNGGADNPGPAPTADPSAALINRLRVLESQVAAQAQQIANLTSPRSLARAFLAKHDGTGANWQQLVPNAAGTALVDFLGGHAGTGALLDPYTISGGGTNVAAVLPIRTRDRLYFARLDPPPPEPTSGGGGGAGGLVWLALNTFADGDDSTQAGHTYDVYSIVKHPTSGLPAQGGLIATALSPLAGRTSNGKREPAQYGEAITLGEDTFLIRAIEFEPSVTDCST